MIDGGSGRDPIDGGDGNDTLYAGFHELGEIIAGGAGNDRVVAGTMFRGKIDGGTDRDALDMTASVADWVINLDTGATADAETRLRNFEDIATGTGDDSIVGTSEDNRIETGHGSDTIDGGKGDDLILPGTGNDTIAGGRGSDVVSYIGIDFQGSSGVIVSLATSGRQNTGVGNQALTGIEGLIGTIDDDILTGDDQANMLEGGFGRDLLFGGGGEDLLIANTGDIVDGGADSDTLSFATRETGVIIQLFISGEQQMSAGPNDDAIRIVSIENAIGTGLGDRLLGMRPPTRWMAGAGPTFCLAWMAGTH